MTVGLPRVLQDPQVVSAFIVAGFALVGVLAGLIIPRLHKNTRELAAQTNTLETVREQVQNSHGTNLRDDVDRVLNGIDRLADQMATVQLDVSWIRREQLDQADRLGVLEGVPGGI